MLSGIKVVDKTAAEAALKEEERAKKKEKKKLKKEKKAARKEERRKEHATAAAEPSSPSGEAASPRRLPSADAAGAERDAARSSDAMQAGSSKPAAASSREDWMTNEAAGRSLLDPAVENPKKNDKATEAAERAAIAAARELNPYLKDGGDGVPPAGAAAAVVTRPAGVGDGGTSWRLKALRRAQAQAAEEGRDLKEVVSDRWGNIANLTVGLTEQRAAHAKAHMSAAFQRREEGGQPAGGRRKQLDGDGSRKKDDAPGYLQELRSERPQMRRPTQDAGFGSFGNRKLRGDATQQRRPPVDAPNRNTDRRRSGAAVEGAERDRHAGRDDRHRGREGDGAERDRGPDQRHGRGGGAECDVRASQASRDPLGRQADAEAVRAAAGSINDFANDGSFLDRFNRPAEPSGRSVSPDSRSPSPVATMDAQVRQQEAAHAAARAGRDAGAAQPAPRNAAPDVAAAAPAGGGGGNLSTAAALRARLLGKATPAAGPAASGGRKQVDLLPQVDASGRAMPGAFGREAAGLGAPPPGRKPKKIQRYGAEGKRERWTADDEENADLATLVKRQRHEGAADIDEALAENIKRKSRFKETDLDADAEYDFDQGLELYESRSKKGSSEQQAKRQRQAAIADAKRLTSALDRCTRCVASARRPRHLTLALGQHSYMMLPERGSLAEGHVWIVPAEHVASSRRADEPVWTEIRNFKKSLLQMFMTQDLDVVFMETAVKLDDSKSHTIVEAVPLPAKAFAKAPIYFKKGIDDAESEWSQHHAKRLIDTRAKGLRGSIPPNFPYFHVEFGLASGFVHVIDDEQGWDMAFGRSVLAGLLGLDAHVGQATMRTEPEALQRRRATKFMREYEPYNWTAQLE